MASPPASATHVRRAEVAFPANLNPSPVSLHTGHRAKGGIDRFWTERNKTAGSAYHLPEGRVPLGLRAKGIL